MDNDKNSIKLRQNFCILCNSQNKKIVCSGNDYQYGTTIEIFDWCECDDCGHFYINPIPTESSLSLIYPKALVNYEDLPKRNIAFALKDYLDGRRLRKITEHIKDGGKLLDVGCASGALLDLAKKHCKNIHCFHGIDISEAATSAAASKGYNIIISTVEEAELPNSFYDIIILQQVIEHLHDPYLTLIKLRSALKDGGKIIIETPHLGSIERKIFKGFWEGYHIPRHFNLWTVEGMTKMCVAAGYKSIETQILSKPIHWTLSFQNIAIRYNLPRRITHAFSLRNRIPIPLFIFGFVDLVQLKILKKGSGIQYIATK